MEALGAGLAIASLTLQLVDGIDRFKAFRDECRDPTIRLEDLICQLHSVQHLLELVERAAFSAGQGELANAKGCRYELDKSKLRLGELTNLIAKYEAGSCITTGHRNRSRIWARNYIKVYAQQQKIRRYAEKLDRTRAVVHDYFNITILSQVSEIQIRCRASTLATSMPANSPYDIQNCQLNCAEHDPRSSQRSLVKRDSATVEARKQNCTPKAIMTEIVINHQAGTGTFNTGNTQSFEHVQFGSEITMISNTIIRKTRRTAKPKVRRDEPAPIAANDIAPTSAENTKSRNLTYGVSKITLNATSTEEEMTYSAGNHHKIGIFSGKMTMIKNVIRDEEEEEDGEERILQG